MRGEIKKKSCFKLVLLRYDLLEFTNNKNKIIRSF